MSDSRAVSAPETFTCAACHGTFPKGWSDEEALAESVDVFGVALPTEDQAVICDDCYKQMMEWGEANEQRLGTPRGVRGWSAALRPPNSRRPALGPQSHFGRRPGARRVRRA